MKVYQAINAVQAELAQEGITKSRRNQQQGYNFRGIDGFDGYSVSDCGRVYSTISGKTLTPRCVNGYSLVTLGGRNGKQIAIHVLVATAFIGARKAGLVVNHKNGDRTDNRAENLEWVTQSENVLHAYKAGLRTIDEKHRQRAAHLGRSRRTYTDEQAEDIRSAYSGTRGEITAIAARHGLSRYSVSSILRACQ